jgi:type IV pilus assembly protein PilP
MQWLAVVAVLVGVVMHLRCATVGRATPLYWLLPGVPEASAASAQPQIVAQQMEGTRDNYRYEIQGRRDPFEALVKEKQQPVVVVPPGPVIDPTRPREPLERFDLSALKLMGIVWGGQSRRALVRAPDGKGYFVTIGMYMGQNGGRIIAIEEDHLILEEKHRDPEGKVLGKTLTLPLRRKENQQG